MSSRDNPNDRTTHEQSDQISRRNALTSIVAAGVMGTGIVSAAGREHGEVLRRATRDNPINAATIVDLQEETFRQLGRRASIEPIVVEPEQMEARDIVAYAHYVDDRGVMHSYVGSVLPEIDEKTQDANERRAAVKDRHQTAQAFINTDLGTLQDGSFDADNMTQIREQNDDIGECPYGKVQTTYSLYKGDNDSSKFALGSKHRVVPGNNECDSNWVNDYLSPTHDWGISSYDTEARDHEPSGSHSGETTTSFTIGIGTAALNYGHSTPDISRDDESTTTTFEQTFGWNDDYGETNVFRCGSIADREKSWGCDEYLVKGNQEMNFIYGLYYEKFEHSYYFYKSCGGVT